MKARRASSVMTKTGVALSPEPATCTSSVFRDDLHMLVTGFPKSLIALCAMLLRRRPSGIADFSILNSYHFSITCSDISLVSLCVYSVSPGQFMNLFLAFSFESSWELQNYVRGAKIQVRLFHFLSWISTCFWLLELVTINAAFTQKICR